MCTFPISGKSVKTQLNTTTVNLLIPLFSSKWWWMDYRDICYDLCMPALLSFIIKTLNFIDLSMKLLFVILTKFHKFYFYSILKTFALRSAIFQINLICRKKWNEKKRLNEMRMINISNQQSFIPTVNEFWRFIVRILPLKDCMR